MGIDKQAYTVRVFRTLESLQSIQEVWKKLQWHPNTDYDFYRLILQLRENVIAPFVITLSSGGDIKSILVGRLEEATLDFKFGYRVFARPRLRAITIPYGGLLGQDDLRICNHILGELKKALLDSQANVIRFAPLSMDSHLFHAAKSSANLLTREFVVERSSHYRLALPASFDEFMNRMSSKHRSALRRYQRRLAKDSEARVETRLFTEVTEVKVLCEDMEKIAAMTYQRRLGKGFIYDENWLTRLTLDADKGLLRAVVLYTGKNPRAFWLFNVYGGVAHSIATGYDPECSKYSVGTLVFVESVRRLCDEHVGILDFGLGDADYKKRFSSESWREASINIHEATMRGRSLNLSYSILLWINKAAKHVVQKLGFIDRLKKRWRERV